MVTHGGLPQVKPFRLADAVLGHIFGVVMGMSLLPRAVMSFEPASPNTHACSKHLSTLVLVGGTLTVGFISEAGLG